MSNINEDSLEEMINLIDVNIMLDKLIEDGVPVTIAPFMFNNHAVSIKMEVLVLGMTPICQIGKNVKLTLLKALHLLYEAVKIEYNEDPKIILRNTWEYISQEMINEILKRS